jgi:hypothetical protein
VRPSPQEAALNDSSDHETSLQEAAFQEAVLQDASPHEASAHEAFVLTTSFQLAASNVMPPPVASFRKVFRPEFGFGGVKRRAAAAAALISPAPAAPRAPSGPPSPSPSSRP